MFQMVHTMTEDQSKPTVIMLVGLPGSGKSTFAKIFKEKQKKQLNRDWEIFSSDAMREELFGDERVQGTPENRELIFSTLFKRIKKQLLDGKSAIFDATNLNKRRRINFIKQLENVPCNKGCILIATPYKECLQNNSSRSRIVPDEVVKQMYMNFQPPHKSEGWDWIDIQYPSVLHPIDTNILKKWGNYDQGNEHHTLSLGNHMLKTYFYIVDDDGYKSDRNLRYAALWHDIGKPFTRTEVNKKGEIDGNIHYYQHNCVGAYDSLFYCISYDNLFKYDDVYDILDVSNLIYYHMHPYMTWDKSEKALERDQKLLGEEFFKRVMFLEEADVNALH